MSRRTSGTHRGPARLGRCGHRLRARRRSRTAAHSQDAGFATVLVLGLAAVLVLVGVVAAALGAAAVARQRAASAADLSALAAAERVLSGPGVACARAASLAERVAARLSVCEISGDVVHVVVQVRPPGPLGRLGVASAHARAGPAALQPSGW